MIDEPLSPAKVIQAESLVPSPPNPDPAIVGHAVTLINNHVGWMGQRVRGKDEDEDFRPKDDVFFEVLPPEVRESVLAAIVSAARLLKRSFDR
jgi:hypothetical protein